MKIGIIIGSLGFGGAERVSSQLANWWAKNGYEISFYTTKQKPSNEYFIDQRINRYTCYSTNKLKLIRELHKTIIKDKPDIVLIMDTPMCVYAVPALFFTRIPFVVSERSAPNNARIKKTTRYLSRFFIRFADGIIFQTKQAKSCYKKSIQKKSIIIANPLDVSKLPDEHNGERTKKVVAVGRLIKEKNYPLLIYSFQEFSKSYPEFTLEIYGDGSEKEELDQMIHILKLDTKIKLMGNHSDVLNLINDSSVYVLSSSLEGMPNALIEAMALGIPCVSTNCPSGGPAELIQNGINGILVPVDDKTAMVEAMLKIVDNPIFADHLSASSKLIRNILNIDIIANQWLLYFKKITGTSL